MPMRMSLLLGDGVKAFVRFDDRGMFVTVGFPPKMLLHYAGMSPKSPFAPCISVGETKASS